MRASEERSSMTFIESSYLASNWTITNVVLHDVDLNFQSPMFHVAILQVNAGKFSQYYWPQIECQVFPIERRRANVVLCDFDLNFQDQPFQTIISQK